MSHFAAAALVRVEDGQIVESRVAIAGNQGHPLRLAALESMVTGARVNDLDHRIPRSVVRPTTPDMCAEAQDSMRGSIIQALTEACNRATRRRTPDREAG